MVHIFLFEVFTQDKKSMQTSILTETKKWAIFKKSSSLSNL